MLEVIGIILWMVYINKICLIPFLHIKYFFSVFPVSPVRPVVYISLILNLGIIYVVIFIVSMGKMGLVYFFHNPSPRRYTLFYCQGIMSG